MKDLIDRALKINEGQIDKISIEELKGKFITDVTQFDDRMILITTSDDWAFVLLHFNDCCEDVYIADICGELSDLKGLVTSASEVCNESPELEEGYVGDDENHQTWTFYKIDTIINSICEDVNIRFIGKSNGHYSEKVSVFKFKI